MKKNIAVIFGSINSEHDVSVASAASVVEHFPVDDYNLVPIYISKKGTWYTGNYTVESFKTNTFTNNKELYLKFDFENPGFIIKETGETLHIDGAFIMLHGRMGEGGQIQGLLQAANIPFTGCDLLSSALCMDKIYTHMICESVGIPMAPYQVLSKHQEYSIEGIKYPVIVKPAREGSSYGVSYADDKASLEKAIEAAFEYDDRILIEGFIKGSEVGVGILKLKDTYIISDVDQIDVSGNVFDFQEKYHPHTVKTLEISNYPEAVQNQVKSYAKTVFEVLGCYQFSRLDFFVTENHDIYLNEVNTIPGFTASSRYPKMLARQGVEFKELIRKMVNDIL